MGVAALPIAIAASLASGAVGYLGAQRQASAMDAQAKSAENMAAYNATVARSNAQGQAQDLQYQSGVNRFNKQLSQENTARQLRVSDQKKRISLARKEASGVRRGALDYSFSDVLRSEALLEDQRVSDAFYQTGQESAQFNTQSQLNELMANRAIETGRTQAGIIKAEGQNRSMSLRSQADSARYGGYASAVSGIGSAATLSI